ncbi:hypothetical protein AVEN_177475-1 [Araneus ventricosus]|uniref:Uncharacterized protein n=1 Tax=Araneus ventricosus TaxID=182803 RepID=A0A4Y2LWB6_ARAVE|nr:hypothetical protein AVEN_177475-1 [Araneus ventricosus]
MDPASIHKSMLFSSPKSTDVEIISGNDEDYFFRKYNLNFPKKDLQLIANLFRAELLAILEACLWASKTNQQVKVWSERESCLHSFASFDIKSPIAQQTQKILLKSTNIKLRCIKAHVGYSGNEAADVLSKKATQEGIPTYIQVPRNHIKSLLQKESIIRWQNEWDNGETGRSVYNVLPKVKTTPTPWPRPEIMFVTDTAHF